MTSPKAAEDFLARNSKTFCRAYMSTETKSDVVNNMAETFNAYVMHARAKHLIYVLKDIRLALMERIVLKRGHKEKADDKICPRVRKSKRKKGRRQETDALYHMKIGCLK